MTFRTTKILFAVVLVLVFSSQAFASPAEVINNFAFNAAKELGRVDGSYFFSPYSIISAFGMAYAGAAGTTAAEIERALGFTWGLHGELGEFSQNIADGGQVFSANRVWLADDLTLRKDYQNNLYLYYRSSAQALDIKGNAQASRQTINDWVSNKTNGKIPNLLAELDPAARMIITNAVYFNAEWLEKFERRATKPEKFHDGGKVTEVPMMKQNENFSYGEFDGVKVISLPYKGRKMSMLVVLPPEGQVMNIDAETLKQWTKQLSTCKVDLWLPKFRTEKSYQLADLFKALGVREAFTNNADFSGISEAEQLKIDAVIHKTFIDVDEEKTEAAAATAIGMMRATAMPPQYPRAEFHADHPFTYFIVDNDTGTILFMGRQTF